MNGTGVSGMAILILAAGSSSRMGQPKQLLPWKKTTLIGHTIKFARVLTDQFVVVLGSNALTIEPYVPKDKTTVNPDWRYGMGSSLSHGIGYLEKRYAPAFVLVMVVDQPLLKLQHYKNLMLTSQGNPNHICASSYRKKSGVPAIFPKRFFDELKRLNADFGAKKLLETYKSSVVRIETKGELIDLDTPEDYRSVFSRWGK